MDATPREYLTPAEFRSKLEKLSDSDKTKLGRAAKLLAPIIPGWDEDDLLQEAITSTLTPNEGRNCPADVPIVTFLVNAMRGITSNEKGMADAQVKNPISIEQSQEADGFAPHDPGKTPEEEAHSHHLCEKVVRLAEEALRDDEQALVVLQCVLGEWTPREIIKEWGMSEKEFDAARQRMRRALKKTIPRELLT